VQSVSCISPLEWGITVHCDTRTYSLLGILRKDTVTNSMVKVLIEKPIVILLLKKFLIFYGTLAFIIMFKRAHLWFLPRVR
jgi:hypothetical protein